MTVVSFNEFKWVHSKSKALFHKHLHDSLLTVKKENIHILIIRIAAMCTYPVQPVCTSLPSLLFILLFIKSHILFLHILLVWHFSLFYCTFYSLFLFFTYIYALVLCNFYIIFILLHCPLSVPDLIYISLLIIPCIIYYVANKETLNLIPPLKSNILNNISMNTKTFSKFYITSV